MTNEDGMTVIPTVVARSIAEWVRLAAGSTVPADDAKRWADALDPRPTLRDAVAQAVAQGEDHLSAWHDEADAALAVVRDYIADLRNPYAGPASVVPHAAYEAALRDVRRTLGADS